MSRICCVIEVYKFIFLVDMNDIINVVVNICLCYYIFSYVIDN